MPKPNDDQIIQFIGELMDRGDTPEEAIARVSTNYDISGADIALAFVNKVSGISTGPVAEEGPATDPVDDPKIPPQPDLEPIVVEPSVQLGAVDPNASAQSATNSDTSNVSSSTTDIDPTMSSEVAASTKTKKGATT